jgi:hypothetical protein
MDRMATQFLGTVDALLIAPFRLPQDAFCGFLVGSFCLAMVCVVLGEWMLSMAIRFNQGHLRNLKEEIAQREQLSMQAYGMGDREGYQAFNKEANDAWGRHFFTMAAYSAGMLWPVPFALAWLHSRFAGVSFELAWPLSLIVGQTVSYPFIFIPMYILARILFGHARRWLPYFKGVQRRLDEQS